MESRDIEICCPDCGAVNVRAAYRCWLCGKRISADRAFDRRVETVAPAGENAAESRWPAARDLASGFTFHLDSLMLSVTLVAIGFGVVRLSPGLGILFAAFSAPAFVRTAVAARRRRRAGKPLSVGDKVIAFAGSLLVVVTVAVSAGVAFYLMCWVGFCGAELVHMDGGLGIGVLLGIAAGLCVAGYLLWRLWPFRGEHTV